MRTATPADHLGAHHQESAILMLLHGGGTQRLVEAGPARPRTVLGVGAKEIVAANHTVVHALALEIPVPIGKRSLRAPLLSHVILLGGQPLLEFLRRECCSLIHISEP